MSIFRYTSPEVRNWSNNLRDQLSQLFTSGYGSETADSLATWSPALDAYEDKDKYVVSVELPGLKREDIQVTIHDGVLTVSGERKSEREVKEGTVHRTERTYGKFSRSVTLPAEVRAENVAASYKDGVLHIELPKVEEAKPKTVEIKVS